VTRRNTRLNVFVIAATLTVPIAVIVEIGTLAAGHELTWFKALSQAQSVWLRHALLALAAASVGCAFAFREKSDET
jgi:hypothetical protein